jgi:hypothetical protein
MSDGNNCDSLTTLHRMTVLCQQLLLLDMRQEKLGTVEGDVNRSDVSQTRFGDPSFRHTWESLAAALTKAAEREAKELTDTMPTKEGNRYMALIHDVESLNRQLARIDELISQQ